MGIVNSPQGRNKGAAEAEEILGLLREPYTETVGNRGQEEMFWMETKGLPVMKMNLLPAAGELNYQKRLVGIQDLEAVCTEMGVGCLAERK